MSFEVIPSIDVLDGRVVRLTRGRFDSIQDYGEIASLDFPEHTRVHLVDLAGSRDGVPKALDAARSLCRRNLSVQVGGGVRTIGDARAWFDAGAERVVVGTVAAEAPSLFRDLIWTFGAEKIIAAVDVENGVVRVDGWTRTAARPLDRILRDIEEAGVREILVTDISRDGVMRGPSFDFYRRLPTSLRIIASGGVATAGDVASLARIPNVAGCVIGKALLDHRLTFEEARQRAASARNVPVRVVPCLDIRDGRVVKGVQFDTIRDAGDPVECAMRYEAEGADEIAVLDISASDRATATALETVRRIADAIFIPLTVGGGVRSVHDFRALLRSGADRVAINTAAVRRPELISEAAAEFGVQAVVLSCDARDGQVTIRSGRETTGMTPRMWCRRAEELGAGEILLTSVNRDGTKAGFDVELTRSVSSAVRIGVIASGGAGSIFNFREAVESGGARAVLAASLFHERRLAISDVKSYLAAEGIPVR